MTHADADQEQAEREAEARGEGPRLPHPAAARAPWLHRSQPPSAVDLTRFAVWRARAGGAGEEDLLAALALLSAARAEVDQAEAALLFTARAHGLSWPRISQAMGLASPQAAQQRFGRVRGRAASPGNTRRDA